MVSNYGLEVGLLVNRVIRYTWEWSEEVELFYLYLRKGIADGGNLHMEIRHASSFEVYGNLLPRRIHRNLVYMALVKAKVWPRLFENQAGIPVSSRHRLLD